jgi:hypothetical protein
LEADFNFLEEARSALAGAKASKPWSSGGIEKFISGIPISSVRILTTFINMILVRFTTRANCCLFKDLSMSMGCIVGSMELAMYSGPTTPPRVS